MRSAGRRRPPQPSPQPEPAAAAAARLQPGIPPTAPSSHTSSIPAPLGPAPPPGPCPPSPGTVPSHHQRRYLTVPVPSCHLSQYPPVPVPTHPSTLPSPVPVPSHPNTFPYPPVTHPSAFPSQSLPIPAPSPRTGTFPSPAVPLGITSRELEAGEKLLGGFQHATEPDPTTSHVPSRAEHPQEPRDGRHSPGHQRDPAPWCSPALR